jgi:hypothetical protein
VTKSGRGVTLARVDEISQLLEIPDLHVVQVLYADRLEFVAGSYWRS